jgi:hypothetical protein
MHVPSGCLSWPADNGGTALFTEDQSQALLVLTASPHTEGYEKLQLLAVLGQERFTGAGHS